MIKEKMKQADEWLRSMSVFMLMQIIEEEDMELAQKRIELFEWFIEQTESNNTVNNELEKRFNKIQKENAELSILLRDTQIEAMDFEQQNKRYREALENIRNVKYDDDFNPYAYMKLEIFEWVEDALEVEE